MCYSIARSRVGKVILPSNQPRPTASKILRAKKGRNIKSGFATQSVVTAKTSSDPSTSSQAALEEKLLSGLQQRVRAGLGFRGEAAVTALWAELRLLVLFPASGLSWVTGFSLRRHIADLISRFRRT